MTRCAPALLVCLALAAALVGRSVQAKQVTALRASASAQGVELTLVVPRRVYPRDGLARVQLIVRDIAPYRVYIPDYPAFCDDVNPSVAVLDPHGDTLYPPALPGYVGPPPACPTLTRWISLGPGRRLRAAYYVILRGPAMQATLSLRPGTVRTPPVRVRLTARQRLSVNIRTKGGVVSAVARRPAGPHVPLVYAEAVACSHGRTLETAGSDLDLQPATSDRIVARCLHPLAWRAVVGWLNHSVTYINYAGG